MGRVTGPPDMCLRRLGLLLVTYSMVLVFSAATVGHGTLRSTVIEETSEDKEVFRGLLNNFYSDEQDSRDEDELLEDEKLRREEAQEAEEKAEVDEIYEETM